jgi:ribosomal protein L15
LFDKYHPGYFGKKGMRQFHKKKLYSMYRTLNIEKLSNMLEKNFNFSALKNSSDMENTDYDGNDLLGSNQKIMKFNAFPNKRDLLMIDHFDQKNLITSSKNYSLKPDQLKKKKKSSLALVSIKKYKFQKILGKGSIDQPLIVKAPQFSRKAEQKILKSGGCPVKISF